MKYAKNVSIAREKALAIALALAALLLVGLLFWEWTQGLKLQQQLTHLRSIPVTAVPSQKILPEFTLPDAATGFPDFLTRPLLFVSRRAPVIAGKGVVSAMKKGQFVLVGVLITPQQRSALLRDVQTKKIETVALAGVLRGITLDEVAPSRVVLRQGTESEELTLNVQSGPKQAMPPTAQQFYLNGVPVPNSAPTTTTPIVPALAGVAPVGGAASAPRPAQGELPFKRPSTVPGALLNR
jgi:hypothetical protein